MKNESVCRFKHSARGIIPGSLREVRNLQPYAAGESHEGEWG